MLTRLLRGLSIGSMNLTHCHYCKQPHGKCTDAVNRAAKAVLPLYCNRTCAGLGRRKHKTKAQKRAEKAAYDAEYRKRNIEDLKAKKAAYFQRTYDPVKAAKVRKKRMPYHVEYCRRPEYQQYKNEFDKQKRTAEYADFGETWRLLLDLEKEIRTRATKYERLVARGYFTKQAIKQRRERWERKTLRQQT